jgi:AraC-like DNA-binding protein
MRPIPPFSDCAFIAWPAGRAMDRHRHAWFQVIHVLEGELEIDWGDGWRAHRAGDVHVLPPGSEHRLRTRAGHRQFGVNCTAARDERGVLAALLDAFPRPATVRLPGREPALVEISAAIGGVLPEDGLRLHVALDRYALALLARAPGGAHEPLARRLLAYLHAHRDRPIAVAAAARSLDVGRSTVQQLCRRAFGCGLAHAHERLRLAEAARLLAESEIAVGDCAAACGYADLFHFSRAFRRVIGLSPSGFRRSRRDAG